MRPNFLFIGTDKAGSSWLYRTLSRHPEVWLSPAKDLFYFDRYFERGEDWYLSRFDAAPSDARVVGEVCHDYLYSTEAPGRILETLGPETRLLACLREPVDRAQSFYLNRLRSGEGSDITFRQMLETHPDIIASSRYSPYVESYASLFPADRLKVLAFDDLVQDPRRYLRVVTDWLQIDPLDLSDEETARARPAARSRSTTATRLARNAAGAARRAGLESLVGRMKSMPGIEAVLYSPLDEKPPVSAADADFVRAAVYDDLPNLAAVTGVPFDRIWGYER